MLRGIYSAAAGMLAQNVLTDNLANNIANVSTTGFKKVSTAFQAFDDVLMSEMKNGNQRPLGKYAASVVPQGSYVNYAQGAIAQTGNNFNVALNGEGFFKVSLPNGDEAYTRDGHLSANSQGVLTTVDGNKISGKGGEIQLPQGYTEMQIRTNGEVLVFQPGQTQPQIVGQLDVVNFDNPQKLQKIGANLYTSEESPNNNTQNTTVEQGSLELSNVNVIREMVDSMQGMRTYEILQKSIHMQNDTLGKAVNDVGKV